MSKVVNNSVNVKFFVSIFFPKWSIISSLTTLMEKNYQKYSKACIYKHYKPGGLLQPPPPPPMQARGIYPHVR